MSTLDGAQALQADLDHLVEHYHYGLHVGDPHHTRILDLDAAVWTRPAAIARLRQPAGL